MQEKEEKLRALLRAIRIRHEHIEGREEGIDELYLGEGLDVQGIEHKECRDLFSILKNHGLVEGDLRGSPLFEKENVLRLSSVLLTPKGIKTLNEKLPILPQPQPTTPTPSQIINIHNPQNVVAGNNNTIQQTFNQSVQVLIDQIEQSNGSPEEKAEAKSRLRHFLEHPLVVGLASAALGAVL